ncbi:MAG TPA: hypothetical protein VJA47_05210 [archaeon]|nr:hypothetical protein [archaeon]
MGDVIQTPSRGVSILNHGGREYDGLRDAVHGYIQKHSANGNGLIGLRAAFRKGDILYSLVNWLETCFEEAVSGGVDYIGGPEAGAGALCGALAMKLTPKTDPKDWENVKNHKHNIGHIKIMKYLRDEDVPAGFESRRYPTGRYVKGPEGEEREHRILAIERGAIEEPPKRVILLDDWAETYTQLGICADLIESQGGQVVGAATVVSIQDGREDFEKRHPHTRPLLSLIDYERLADRSLRRLPL